MALIIQIVLGTLNCWIIIHHIYMYENLTLYLVNMYNEYVLFKIFKYLFKKILGLYKVPVHHKEENNITE